MRAKDERVGLLFVHGIGEQARFEHLTTSVRELAELWLRTIPGASVSVVDRTSEWKLPAGVVHPDGMAMVEMTLATPEGRTVYECNEVWWADLGCRSGIFDSIGFWLWGLGQWAAPIYQALDAARVEKRGLVILPQSVAGHFLEEVWARLRLLKAALAAVFIGVTWALAKQVFRRVLGTAPSPTLIVRYVGDVRTYETRGAPGESTLQDPGAPRRVGIRRRMVTEMVAMGSRPELKRWYVIAHSLGSVVAYNGIAELGHTLPNYLPEAQWDALASPYKTDPHCWLRERGAPMMPARPSWLEDADVVNRPLLFAKLEAFVTYGSPLDKFAGIWPRIVATANDRLDDVKVLGTTHWLNIAAPSDPVAGMLCRFPAGPGDRLAGAVPQVSNVALPFRPLYGLAHIRYFSPTKPENRNAVELVRREFARYLAGGDPPPARRGLGILPRIAFIYIPYLCLVAALWLVTSGVAAAAVGLLDGVFAEGFSAPGFISADMLLPALREIARDVLVISCLVLDGALAFVAGFGLWRWFRESLLNRRLAQAEKKRSKKPAMASLIRMSGLQAAAAVSVMLLGAGFFAWAIAADYRIYNAEALPQWNGPEVGALVIAAAIAAQALINYIGAKEPSRGDGAPEAGRAEEPRPPRRAPAIPPAT